MCVPTWVCEDLFVAAAAAAAAAYGPEERKEYCVFFDSSADRALPNLGLGGQGMPGKGVLE